MIDESNGVLPILTFDAQHSWNHLLQLCQHHLDGPGLERIKAAVGTAAKTVFVERHYIDKDYRDTFSNYHSKKFHTPDARCVRLHFFAKALDRNALVHPDGLNDGKTMSAFFLRRWVTFGQSGRVLQGRAGVAPLTADQHRFDMYRPLCRQVDRRRRGSHFLCKPPALLPRIDKALPFPA
jgi:hypothetical protein